MKNRGVVLVISLTIILMIFFTAFSQGLPAMAKVGVDGRLKKADVAKLSNYQKYDVIVKLENNESIPRNKIKKEFAYGGLVEAELTKGEIAEALNDNSIVSIQRTFRIDLTASTSIINATRTWPILINGVNLTGVNQSICIIDTGVDYTHADLGGCYGNNNASSGCKVIGGFDFYNGDSDPMDDHGHGTHVAGIAAANGTIKGVAPSAKIIAIKSMSSSGGGSDADIISGIEWCIGNASRYNIGVISLSLGDSVNYTSYCNSDTLAPSINEAVGKNITVVVAAGNSGNFTSLSSPACIENATAIGATNDDDSVASYSNRNSLMRVLAPGSSISSTCFGGGSCSSSGTSMATPHVAGEVALIKQFLALNSMTLTNAGINNALNNSGKIIYDSLSGLNYSRISTYDTLSALSFNFVNLSSPANGILSGTGQNFTCNVSSVIVLNNMTFYLWNSTGMENSSTAIFLGVNNGSTFSYNFTHEGIYTWNCLAYNNATFSSYAPANYTITYDITAPTINVTTPLNNSWMNGGIFNLSINENGSCIYSLNGGIGNFSMNSSDNLNFFATNNTLTQDGQYNVTYYCNDSIGNRRSSSITFFRVDLLKPNVTIISPADGYSNTDTTTIDFQYNASDNLNLSHCNLILNGVSVASNSTTIGNATNIIAYSVDPGSYRWNINCTDEAGNIGNSSNRSLTINSVSNSNSGSSSSGGGGGGGGASSSAITELIGSSVQLSSSGKVRFKVSGSAKDHTLTVNSITPYYASLTIMSEPINLTLRVGESKKLNLSSAEYYDLYIKLESLAGSKVNLTIKTILEAMATENVSEVTNKTEEQNFAVSSEWKSKIRGILIKFAIAAGIIIMIYFALKLKSKHPKRKRNRVRKSDEPRFILKRDFPVVDFDQA